MTTDIARTVVAFATTARLAAASFLGLTITIIERSRALADHVVLRLTLLDASGDVETSLVLSGPTDTTDDQPGIEVVLYAGTPGAFIDLAADLAFMTDNGFTTAALDQHQGLAGEPDITGVIHADMTVHEAVGVLLAGGHTREQAYTELDTLAGAAHTDRATEASKILTALSSAGLGPPHR